MIRSRATSFNDGVLQIFSVSNDAAPGNRPRGALELKIVARYAERVVGVTRHYEALRCAGRVDRVLRIPRARAVETSDICVPTDGRRYRVRQIQHVADERGAPVTDIALERIGEAHAAAEHS